MWALLWAGSIIGTILLVEKKNQHWAYLLLTLVFGPLGLIVVLLLPDRQPDEGGGDAPLSPSQARQELAALKSSLAALQRRIWRLEQTLNIEPSLVETHPAAAEPSPPQTGPVRSVAAPKPASSDEGLEVQFGKYWLNRLGVVLFVIGVGLFISYTFHYLPALAKVALGYGLAGLFFGWGRWLERRDKHLKLAGGIIGGAWGLLYLSTFALHFIDATRVIDSGALAIFLLMFVSAAAVFFNLKYRSQVVTGVTYALGFITVGLDAPQMPVLFYLSLLSMSIVFLGLRFRWAGLKLLGLTAAFLTPLLWDWLGTARYVYGDPAGRLFDANFLFLNAMLTWLIFSIGQLLWKNPDDRERRILMTSQLVNAGFFSIQGYEAIQDLVSYTGMAFHPAFRFFFGLGMAYAVLAMGLKLLRRPALIVSSVCLAMGALGLAFWTQYRFGTGYVWMLQMTGLFVLGMYYREVVYRWLSVVWGAGVMLHILLTDMASSRHYAWLGLSVPHDILIVSLTAAAGMVLGILADSAWGRQRLEKDEQPAFVWMFTAAGAALLVILLGDEMPSRWMSLSWAAAGLGLLGAGFGFRHFVLRMCGLGVLSLASLRLIFVDMSGVNTIYKIIAFMLLGAVLLGVSMVYGKLRRP